MNRFVDSTNKHMIEGVLMNEWDIWFCFLKEEEEKGNEKYDQNLRKQYSIHSPAELAFVWAHSDINSLRNYLPRDDLRQKAYLVDGKWRRVNSLEFFKKGILPQWEDANNAKGGRFIIPINRNQENNEQIYESFVFFLIGEDFDLAHTINGFRFIASKNTNQSFFRVEIWVRFDRADNERLTQFSVLLDTLLNTLNINLSSVQFKNNRESPK